MGGGGDGGAGQARQDEADRQARINAAVAKINGIFDGVPTARGTGKVAAVEDGKTYYDATGNRWQTPYQTITEGGPINTIDDVYNLNNVTTRQVVDQAAIDKALAEGLYSGVENIAPTQTRQQLYEQQKSAVFDINKRDVDKQFKDAERQNRFGLARAGLMGGSADIDSNAELQERLNEGTIKAAGLGDAAAADLKTQDERSRQNLISMAQSGIDSGTAGSMALRQLDANAQSAAGARQGATIGSLFSDMAQAYLMKQQMGGMNAGRNQAQQWYGVSTPQQSYPGSVQRT